MCHTNSLQAERKAECYSPLFFFLLFFFFISALQNTMLGSKFESSKKMNDFIMIAPQLVVSNAVTTAEYYRDQLGFEILGYFSDPPVFAMVRRNGVEIHFGKADGVSSQSSNVLLRSVGSDLYVWVDNVDQLYQEFLKQEVKISEKPQNRSYLTREFSIIDCNGIKITFASDLN